MATFRFDLVAPDRLTFSGDVDQVDVPGVEGDFGVLANHAPIVALLRPGILTVYAGGSQQQFVVLGGFAEMSVDGSLTILADIAVTIGEFDGAALQAHITEMEAALKDKPRDALLDREIAKLDHFKQVQQQLQGAGAR